MTEKRGLLIACAIAAAATLVAWLIRWGCDDAFISFVYARSLVQGHGVTWFGTQVEGYTNFAWVLWSALGEKLGLAPLGWAWAASLASLAVAIITTYRIGALRRSPLAGLAAAGILATNYTFLAYGTSGLETMLQTALLASALLEVERMRRSETAPTGESAAVLSLIAALALWTRLDSAPMLAVLGLVAAHRLAKAQVGVRTWVAAIMPAFVMVGGWFLWKVATYGDVLPNTFYAKAGSGSVAHGAVYAWSFARTYVLWPFLAGIAALAIVRRVVHLPALIRGTPIAKLPLALVAAQTAYVIAVGGDFMELRFFVPLLPPLALAIAELITTPSRIKPALQVAVAIAVLAAFSLRHAATYDGDSEFTVDSVRNLSTFYNKVSDNDWGALGAALRADVWPFRPIIACEGAGAIPYYADLPTIDQLGLNDEWVARHGDHAPEGYLRPGHQRFATLDYLLRSNVTFVIGQPILVSRGTLAHRSDMQTVTRWLGEVLGPQQTYGGPFDVVAAPIDDEHELLMWYLTPDPAISARIAGWDHVRLRGR